MKPDASIDIAHFACPHCGFVHVHELLANGPDQRAFEYSIENTRDQYKRFHAILRCVRCRRETYRLMEIGPIHHSKGGIDGLPPDWQDSRTRVLHQFPVGVPDSPHIPAGVKAAMTEAEKCLAVNAPSACGTMARRAVDAMTRDKKATGKDLYERLVDLKAKAVITEDLYAMAEEARVAGKHGAHPEWEDLTPDQAEYAVGVLRELVRYVYVLPSERNAVRLKQTSKKKS